MDTFSEFGSFFSASLLLAQEVITHVSVFLRRHLPTAESVGLFFCVCAECRNESNNTSEWKKKKIQSNYFNSIDVALFSDSFPLKSQRETMNAIGAKFNLAENKQKKRNEKKRVKYLQ